MELNDWASPQMLRPLRRNRWRPPTFDRIMTDTERELLQAGSWSVSQREQPAAGQQATLSQGA